MDDLVQQFFHAILGRVDLKTIFRAFINPSATVFDPQVFEMLVF
jgi:hypothetical protein